MGIEELKGIGKEKEKIVEKVDTPKYVKLIDIGQEYVQLLTDKVIAGNRKHVLGNESYLINFYDFIHKDLLKKKISDFDYDSKDLEEFVRFSGTIMEKMLFYQDTVYGIYSGCLLDILTARNKKRGQRTTVHIKGEHVEFSNLFMFAANVDILIVEDVRGGAVLSFLGSFGGSADTIIIKDCNTSTCANNIAYQGGKAKNLVIVGGTGYQAGKESASKKGNIELVLSIDSIFDNMFEDSFNTKGELGLGIFYKCAGSILENQSSNKRKIKKLILKNRTKPKNLVRPGKIEDLEGVETFSSYNKDSKNDNLIDQESREIIGIVEKIKTDNIEDILASIAKIREIHFKGK